MKKSKNSITSWLNEHRNPEIDKLVEQQAKQIMKHSSIEQQYLDLLQDILDNGVEKKDRTGTGTLSVFGRQIRHDMSEGYPLLTTKKMAFKTMVKELLWFLSGSTDIRFLWKNNCKIWDWDWYKAYCKSTSSPYSLDQMKEFALKGDRSFHDSVWNLGPIYGASWRNWGRNEYPEYDKYNRDNKGIDQIQNAINLLKTDPDSRRNRVDAWNVGEVKNQVVPPCHTDFQFYTRELSESERFNWYGNKMGSHMHHDHIIQEMDKNNVPKRALSLMWNQRSVDTFLGLPFNIASYGLLLEIIAKEVNMVPDELIGTLGDVHLYKNHIEQAKEQLTRKPYTLPQLEIAEEVKWKEGDCLPYYSPSDFKLVDYQSHPTIKAPLSN